MPLAKIDRSASSGAHGYLRWTTTVSGDGARRRLDGRVDEAPALAGLGGLVDGELHVLGRHRLAVGELHALPERERVGLLVRGHLVAGGQLRHHALAVGGDRVQRAGRSARRSRSSCCRRRWILFMDWASWTAAKVSLPPCTGVPALVLPPLVDPPLVVPPDPPLDPQAASTTSAPAAVSAFSAVVRFVMKAPALMGAARGAAGNRSEQTFVQVNVAVTRRFVNRGSWG